MLSQLDLFAAGTAGALVLGARPAVQQDTPGLALRAWPTSLRRWR
jgi:hypothetical protein